MRAVDIVYEQARAENVIISVCMFCGVLIDKKDPDGSVPCVSHGLCQDCLDEKYGEELN